MAAWELLSVRSWTGANLTHVRLDIIGKTWLLVWENPCSSAGQLFPFGDILTRDLVMSLEAEFGIYGGRVLMLLVWPTNTWSDEWKEQHNAVSPNVSSHKSPRSMRSQASLRQQHKVPSNSIQIITYIWHKNRFSITWYCLFCIQIMHQLPMMPKINNLHLKL